MTEFFRYGGPGAGLWRLHRREFDPLAVAVQSRFDQSLPSSPPVLYAMNSMQTAIAESMAQFIPDPRFTDHIGGPGSMNARLLPRIWADSRALTLIELPDGGDFLDVNSPRIPGIIHEYLGGNWPYLTSRSTNAEWARAVYQLGGGIVNDHVVAGFTNVSRFSPEWRIFGLFLDRVPLRTVQTLDLSRMTKEVEATARSLGLVFGPQKPS